MLIGIGARREETRRGKYEDGQIMFDEQRKTGCDPLILISTVKIMRGRPTFLDVEYQIGH